MNPEHYVISAAVRGTSSAAILGAELRAEMFEHYATEWQWISDYVNKYRRVPPKQSFRGAFPDFQIASVDDLAYQADEVRKSYANRRLRESIGEVVAQIRDGHLDAALAEMQKGIVSTAQTLGTVPDGDVLRDHSDVMGDIEDFHDRIVETGFAGIPTGFKTWDSATGGCKPGELIIVGARLGEGKSWTMTKMASTALMEGYTVLYDSLEMTRTNITLRVQNFLTQAIGRPYAAADLLTGTSVPDLVGYREVVAQLSTAVPGKLHVADTTRGRISPITIAAQIERIQPDIVFVDYLTLLDMTGDGDWKSVSALSKSMQGLAQKYRIPIVVASQLNRADGRTRDVPGSDALARSDSVGQDADQVMNTQRKSRRVMRQKLAKNRHGVDGLSWYCEFRPGAGIFEEINSERAFEMIDEDGDADA